MERLACPHAFDCVSWIDENTVHIEQESTGTNDRTWREFHTRVFISATSNPLRQGGNKRVFVLRHCRGHAPLCLFSRDLYIPGETYPFARGRQFQSTRLILAAVLCYSAKAFDDFSPRSPAPWTMKDECEMCKTFCAPWKHNDKCMQIKMQYNRLKYVGILFFAVVISSKMQNCAKHRNRNLLRSVKTKAWL